MNIHVILLTKLYGFAALQDIVFLAMLTSRFNAIVLTAGQYFEINFSVHVRYFACNWTVIFESRPILLHLKKFSSQLK